MAIGNPVQSRLSSPTPRSAERTRVKVDAATAHDCPAQPPAGQDVALTVQLEVSMADQKIEGEGNHTAARQYNEMQRHFVEAGKVDQAAQEAEQSINGPEAEELQKAEEIGKSHSHGEDPAVQQSDAGKDSTIGPTRGR